MGRKKKNALELTGDAVSGYHLRGHIMGERIRLKSYDIDALASIKNAKEHAYAELQKQNDNSMVLRQTWLSEAQLRDAEAAVRRAKSHTLLDCVIAAERVLPAVDRIVCITALAEWIDELRARGRYPRTLKKNQARVAAFLSASESPRHLTDLTPEMARQWIFRRGQRGYTPLTDATVLLAWLRWCQRKRYFALLPFDVDMRDLSERSRAVAVPKILTPAQCGALLEAAAKNGQGELVPYVVLTTWCMLRHAEALRTTAAQIKLNLANPVVEVHPRKRRTVSYRQVPIPANVLPLLRAAVERGAFVQEQLKNGARKPVRVEGAAFGKTRWETIRAAAGLIQLGKTTAGKRRPVLATDWQENILRHTGISLRYQQTGDMKLVCREAGNSDDTSFRHYLTLPMQGAAAEFYSAELVAAATEKYLTRSVG